MVDQVSPLKGRKQSAEHIAKRTAALKGKVPWNKGEKCGPPSTKTRRKISKALVGHTTSAETRRKISDAGVGRKQSLATRRKRRLTILRRIEARHGQVHPGYNPVACRLIEAYGKEHGFHFQHAENGGEFHIKALGYFVDGYDAAHNVVVEVYEPWHGRQVERDKQRQREIEQHLGCRFVVLRTDDRYV